MRTVFVANTAWYLENFRTSTLRSFASTRKVVCLYPKGCVSRSLRKSGVQEQPFYLDASSTNPIKELVSLIALTWQIARHRPDIVFSFNPKTNLYSLIACWLLRIPCVPNVSGVGVASQMQGVLGKVYRTLVGFFYKRASHVFFQNNDDYQAFLQAGWVRAQKSEIIPGSGVDLKAFRPTDKERSSVRFLMASRLIKPKGVIEFIEAARKVVSESDLDCEFILAGVNDTSDRAVPKDFLDELAKEKRIHFLGHIEDMPTLLQTIDYVVLPSYYPEGVPRSLIEAAAAGKAIITTDTPGCREVVLEGENGFFVKPQSVESLALAMHRALKLDNKKLEYMKRASRVLAEERFDEKIIIHRYLEIADQLKPAREPKGAGTF